ncbi:PLD nuclease N-terminal domain-containing protein [Rothia sp. AR01]|uniref:PLD nuclease N-terminal domain-containing protein n=1 Tax=Rothia santali TaxID=2949643 RepID=A0A9X2HIU2_9MICC|nr:PLD nuclease N-terminal domain-containing protein [Rothia santali]MCP3425038.1 PLD nuclease N-terminal domain-containing protein [Rothia santali]
MRAVLIIAAGALIVGLTIYAVLDISRTSRERIKAVSKPLWVIIALLFPVIGPGLWLFFGTERSSGSRVVTREAPGSARAAAPDDDASYLEFLAKQAQRRRADEERARREEEKRRQRERGGGTNGNHPPDDDEATDPTPSDRDDDGPREDRGR